MRSFTSSRPVWSASSTARASAMSSTSSAFTPHGSSVIVSSQVRIHPCSMFCSGVRSSRATSRRICSRTLSGTPSAFARSRYSWARSSPSPSSPSSLRMAASCWRRRNSRWVLSMPSETSRRICSFNVRSASVSLAHARALLEAGLDVEGLEQLDLLLHRQVGGVAGHVGHLLGVGEAADGVGEAAGAPRLEDVLDDGLVLARQLGRAVAGRGRVDGLGVDPQRVAGAGDAGADRGAVQAADDEGAEAASQLTGVLDRGHDADPGVAAVDAGDEEEALVRRPRPRRRGPRRSRGRWSRPCRGTRPRWSGAGREGQEAAGPTLGYQLS